MDILDRVEVKFLQTALFISVESFKTLEKDTKINTEIVPQHF